MAPDIPRIANMERRTESKLGDIVCRSFSSHAPSCIAGENVDGELDEHKTGPLTHFGVPDVSSVQGIEKIQ